MKFLKELFYKNESFEIGLKTETTNDILANMEYHLQQETNRLRNSWMKHKQDVLKNYLVEDVQDPRINVQSIICRNWLLEQLFDDKFMLLAEHELRFAMVMNWLNTLYKNNIRLNELQAILFGLIEKQDEIDGINIPAYVSTTFALLPQPNYIFNLLNWTPHDTGDIKIPEYLVTVFQKTWADLLEHEQTQKISVLEPACGSANDYRFLESFGISRFLEYFGFDLCPKNISNAKKMFPTVHFDAGNVLEIQADDKSFDYCYVHDLFEHFSIEAMEMAIKEICRVTRKGICVSFFNMHNEKEHITKEVHDYHWNRLSMPILSNLFNEHFEQVHAIHIDSFLASKFSCSDTQNKNAYTFIVS